MIFPPGTTFVTVDVPELSWEQRVDAAIVGQQVTPVLLGQIQCLLATIKREIAIRGDGDVSEEEAIALVKIYAYRRQCGAVLD